MKFIFIFFILTKGEYSLEFLKFGIGAREISLSNSDIISPSPSVAPLYNPACIGENQFSFTLNKSFAFNNILEYNYAGFSLPILKKYFFAVGFLYSNIPDIPLYSNPIEPGDTNFYPSEGYFNYTQKAFLFSFAWKKVPVGLNFKVIHQKMLEGKGLGIGFDIGTKYFRFTKFGKFSFAFVIKDIGGTKVSWQDKEKGEEITGFYAGAGYSKEFGFFNLKIFGTGFYDYDFYTSTGFEISLWKSLFLRIGFLYFDLFSAGAGLKLKFIELDYGFKRNIAGSTHSISLTFKKI